MYSVEDFSIHQLTDLRPSHRTALETLPGWQPKVCLLSFGLTLLDLFFDLRMILLPVSHLRLFFAVATNTSLALETYFGRSLGLALLALGLMVVVLSGALPLGTTSDGKHALLSPNCTLKVAKIATEAPDGAPSPYAAAAILISTLHHVSSAFYCYGRYAWTDETGFLLGCAGSTIFATFGIYCVLFAGDKAMTSRYHKFDQSTSGFPFSNSQSYRAKKKAL